jgi:hypothetical protein
MESKWFEEIGLDPKKDADIIKMVEESGLNAKNYRRFWIEDMKKSDLEELLENGESFAFQYANKDYFIDPGPNGYLIVDPCVGKQISNYPPYPESEMAHSVEELRKLPFLDGKTMSERFDDMRFFE